MFTMFTMFTEEGEGVRKIAPILFKFVYIENPNSVGVERTYNRIFELANKKMKLDIKSIKEYSGIYGRDRNIFDPRGSSQKNESRADYRLPNVQSKEDSGNKVWRSMENQPKETDSVIKKEGR